MACDGSGCSVQIFDVNVSQITCGSPMIGTALADKLILASTGMCSTPTQNNIADGLRPNPKWVQECPSPAKDDDDACICDFLDADLDPNSGWSAWTPIPAPTGSIPLPGTEGPNLPQNKTCRYQLYGTYFQSSKTIQGACKPAPRKKPLPKRLVDGLHQRNPHPLPKQGDAPPHAPEKHAPQQKSDSPH